MNINTLNRFELISNIRIAWKTDYMHKHISVRNIPIFKSDFANPN